jgi:UPF0716 protein FxsA
MVLRLFFVYVLVELAVVVALASTIGFGWTLLIVLAMFFGGLAVAGSQIKRQIQRLQSGRLTTPQGAVTDGALIALGTVLMVAPGLVTSALGLLLLLPPTRAVARPVLTAMAARSISRRVPLVTVVSTGPGGFATDTPSSPPGDYIDGEVIDVTEDEPPAVPRAPE